MDKDSEKVDISHRTTSPMQDYSECSICIGILVFTVGLYFTVLLPFVPNTLSILIDFIYSIVTGSIASALVTTYLGIRNREILKQINKILMKIESQAVNRILVSIFIFVLSFIVLVGFYTFGEFLIFSTMELIQIVNFSLSLNISADNIRSLGLVIPLLIVVILYLVKRRKELVRIIKQMRERWWKNSEMESGGTDTLAGKKGKQRSEGVERRISLPKQPRLKAGRGDTGSLNRIRYNTSPQGQMLNDLQFTIGNQIEEIRSKRKQATRHIEILVFFYALIPISRGILEPGSLSVTFFGWLKSMDSIAITLGVGASLFSVLIDIFIISKSTYGMGLHEECTSLEDTASVAPGQSERVEIHRNIYKSNQKLLKRVTWYLSGSYISTFISLALFVFAISR